MMNLPNSAKALEFLEMAKVANAKQKNAWSIFNATLPACRVQDVQVQGMAHLHQNLHDTCNTHINFYHPLPVVQSMESFIFTIFWLMVHLHIPCLQFLLISVLWFLWKGSGPCSRYHDIEVVCCLAVDGYFQWQMASFMGISISTIKKAYSVKCIEISKEINAALRVGQGV